MITSRSFLRLALVFLWGAGASVFADSVVTFNELHYNPPGTQDGEWIELHNQMAVNVDLSGWRLDDGVEFSFPSGTVIPGGGFLVIAKNPALSGLSGALGPYSGNLSNSGETVGLISRSGRVMDRVSFGDSGEWPLAADGAGASLAKRLPGSDSGKAASWTFNSLPGGTPGALNFPPADVPIRHVLADRDSNWRFKDDGAAPPGSWNTAAFDDSSWLGGQATFGSASMSPALTVSADLVERYRAASVTGVSNGAVFGTWNDTATGDGATQNAAAGGNPTYRTNATPSSMAVVRFDGNDEFRTSVSPGIAATSGFVYFIVCKANAASQDGRFILDRNNSLSDAPLASLKVTNGRYEFQKRYDSNNGLGGPVSATTVSTTSYQIVAIRRNPAASRFEIWVDGVMEGSVADTGESLTPQPVVIGRHATSPEIGFNGDIAELLVYRNALSEDELRSVGSYLEAAYGLDTAFPDTAIRTNLATNPATSYFRKSFNFTGNPSRTTLRLNQTIADGAVFYLNGVELTRTNLAGGSVGHGSTALSDVTQPAASGFQSVSPAALVSGANVLAVSLHKAASNSSALFAAELEATEDPPDPSMSPALQFHEIAGSEDAGFFIEIRNPGETSVSTAGATLSIAGSFSHPLPPETIAAGGLRVFTQGELGFRPAAGDKLVLKSADTSILDVQLAATGNSGRSDSMPGAWLRLPVATPGAGNLFTPNDSIVINEICYKAPPNAAVTGTPAVIESVSLVSFGDVWRYNQTGPSLATGWASISHPIGSGWSSGAGPLAYSNNTLPVNPGTTLNTPSSNNPFVVTYYFEKDLTLTAAQATGIQSLTFSHLIDDGAVFYLNGTEIGRYNMADGGVTSSTFATTGVSTASVSGPVTFPVPPGTAVTGTNRISVEVHQISTSSSDIVFGLQASATVLISPGTPDVPETPSNQQWIELHNRGASSVDLTGWRLSAGVDFNFPAGTVMPAGGYLVVARDPALVPAAVGTVMGPWSGSLSGMGERVLLRDALGNPADGVAYVDGGRWPAGADGAGSTLELRDPRSDNSSPESWAASDESSRRAWETITWQGTAAASAVGPDWQWREFVLGLLDAGEVLIDDLSVTENPATSAVAMISGGNFESGTNGWRFLGNHMDATVFPEPGNSTNHVLHLKATGPTEHMHNHVETTLRNSLSVVNGRIYRISFRAKWLSGSNKINARLYFNRLAGTRALARGQLLGTPGAANTRLAANVGPGFTHLSHSPVVPEPGEPVTITASATDPDGVASMTLFYSQNGGSYASVPMAPSTVAGTFTAEIPGAAAASVVRFHVGATDASGSPATSFFPAEGAASHALYQVNDGLAADNGLHNIRIVMDPADEALLYQTNNLMSNGRIGCTVIYDEREVYYNAGVRLKSSQRGRPVASRVGFNLLFNDDQLFRGIHKTIAIDRSEGAVVGAQEILYDHMMYTSGGVPAECNDLVKVIAPDPAHTSTAILQLARFGSEFLDSQFENGADGTVYEYELIYYPTTTDANGYKLPQPDDVVGVGVTSLGADKENYRWTYLTKNNEEKDDYSRIIAMTGQFDKSGAAFDETVNEVLDVDQWLRALAYSCASGAVDSFFSNSGHNGQFYARPSDGRVLYFPHDLDYFSSSLPIFTNTELQKLTANSARKRIYLGHLHDICTTVFNQSYMADWTTHYGSLLPNENFSAHLSYINTRSNYILSSIQSEVASVSFAITTNGGANFTSTDTPVQLAGQGWVNVRYIRIAGSSLPLNVTWTSVNTWETQVPLGVGLNNIQLEAVDFNGNVVGTDSIGINHTGGTQLPGSNNLVVSEIYYNPLMSDDLSEYIELRNISSTYDIDLSGLAFTQGIAFTFPNQTTLAPGARVLVVKNLAAFQSEFGTAIPVAGVFTGSLDNAGETLTLRRADSTLVRTFAYSDDPPWPVIADTDGHSLVLVSPLSNPDHADPLSWRASLAPGGAPGAEDSLSYDVWKLSHGNPPDDSDVDGDGFTPPAEYLLGGDPSSPDPDLRPDFEVLSDGSIRIFIHRRADASEMNGIPESSTTLSNWGPPTGMTLLGNTRMPGTPEYDRLEFLVPKPGAADRHFVRIKIR